MALGLSMDVSSVTRGMAKLAKGLDHITATTGYEHAQRTAAEIHAAVPVWTGALQSTCRATRIPYGGDVHYGGTLPYARKIERRTHVVANALAGAPGRFQREMTALAQQEIVSL